MSAVLPAILFRTNRGLCPACGAPLRIDPESAEVTCGFCGQSAVLERRVRKSEPELPDAPLRLYPNAADADPTADRSGWIRNWSNRSGEFAHGNCPGCGDRLDYRDDATILVCPSCDTDCRLEQRLRAPLPDPESEVPRPRRPSERLRADNTDGDHPDTEHLVWRIVHEPDADRRLALAGQLGLLRGSWGHINATLARLLPTLLAATGDAEPALQAAVADGVGKLLCEGNRALRNVALRAAERFLFEARCPRALVFAVGLGDGVCLKPLFDAAELAARRGDLDQACWCLHAVGLVFQRNYEQHDVMGQVVLYRLLYLSGPVLAYALLLSQRQFGIGFYHPAEALLAYIDDAAVERPGLLPELDKSFYVGWPADESAFAGRLTTYSSLKTDAARSAALRHYLGLPEQATDAQWDRLLTLVLPIWETHGPLKSAAASLLYLLANRSHPTPRAVHRLVAAKGRTLPVEVQRSYLSAHPDTPHLSYDGLPYRRSPADSELTPEMRGARDDWNDGICRSVEANEAARNETSRRLADVRELEVELYDGEHDGPAAVEADRGPATSTEDDASDDPEDDASADAVASEEVPETEIDSSAAMKAVVADPSMVEAYRQVVRQMTAMREQVRTFSPESAAMIDQQIEQIRRMFPGEQL